MGVKRYYTAEQVQAVNKYTSSKCGSSKGQDFEVWYACREKAREAGWASVGPGDIVVQTEDLLLLDLAEDDDHFLF